MLLLIFYFIILKILFFVPSLNAFLCHDTSISLSSILNTINENIPHYFGNPIMEINPGIELQYTNNFYIKINEQALKKYLSIDDDDTWNKERTANNISQSTGKWIIQTIKEMFNSKANYENFISILYDLLLIRCDLTYKKNNEHNKGILMRTMIESDTNSLLFITKISSFILQDNQKLSTAHTKVKQNNGTPPTIIYDKNGNVTNENEVKKSLLDYLSDGQPYNNSQANHQDYLLHNLITTKALLTNGLLQAITIFSLDRFYEFYQRNPNQDQSILNKFNGMSISAYIFMIRFSPLQECLVLKKTLPPWYLLVPRGHVVAVPALKINSDIEKLIEKNTITYFLSHLYHESGDFTIKYCDEHNELSMVPLMKSFTQKFIRMKSLLDFIPTYEKAPAKLFFNIEYNLIDQNSNYAPILLQVAHIRKIIFLTKAFLWSLLSISIVYCLYHRKNSWNHSFLFKKTKYGTPFPP